MERSEIPAADIQWISSLAYSLILPRRTDEIRSSANARTKEKINARRVGETSGDARVTLSAGVSLHALRARTRVGDTRVQVTVTV